MHIWTNFRAIAQYTGNGQQDNSRSGVCVSVHVHYACITNIPASQLQHLQWCNLTLARLPGASEYHNGQKVWLIYVFATGN